MSDQADARDLATALRKFYEGEVIGEGVYGTFLAQENDPERRIKLSYLLQYEVETKVWLRLLMRDDEFDRIDPALLAEETASALASLEPLEWSARIMALKNAIDRTFIPMYEDFLQAARLRGDSDGIAICEAMVDHERAQTSMFERELAGEGCAHVVEPIARRLTGSCTSSASEPS